MDHAKKTYKKRRRFESRLRDSKGIQCTDIPQTNIVLCNAGRGTGLQKEEVYTYIKKEFPDILLPKYIAPKGQTYSYLIFDSTLSAHKFYEKFNGCLELLESATLIYMTYIETVPNREEICAHTDPEGLQVLENFINTSEENVLLQVFDCKNDTKSNELKNRQVNHYGYEFRYGSNDVDLNAPLDEKIPIECDFLWNRLRQFNVSVDRPPDQLTVNKYSPGQGIPSHVDRHSPFGETILSLSLGASVVMDWKHHTGIYIPVFVPLRSLLIMRGEARYDWQHGIQARTWDPVINEQELTLDSGEFKKVKVISDEECVRGTRMSLTFRWTRSGPCECIYKTLCDSHLQENTNDIENNVATDLEDLHVHQVYEKIAGHFSNTRHKPWPKVVEFMSNVEKGSIILDLGCGNGKNILSRSDIMQIGAERSLGLIAECKNNLKDNPGFDCLRMDLINRTLIDGCADIVICIAVIHHFSSKARRLQAIKTISELLRKGAKALITVWAKDQSKANYLCKNKQESSHSESVHTTAAGVCLPVHENRTQFLHNDVLVPWKLRSVSESKQLDTLLRYYHVFEEGELDSLCLNVPELNIIESFYEEGNWCVICKKI